MASPKKKPQSLLPTTKNVPSSDLWDYCILVFGAKGIGKTTMFSHAGNLTDSDPLTLAFEPGSTSLETYQVKVPTWTRALKLIRELENSDKFNPIVWDTADIAYELCTRHVCKRKGIDHPSDEGYGKGWNAIRSEYGNALKRILDTGRGLALISHDTERKIEIRGGGEYDVIVPTMSGQARDIIEGMVDVIVHYHFTKDRRIAQIIGDDHTVAKNRIEGHFEYTDGTPMKYIDMGDCSNDAWDNFVAAFNNRLDKPKLKEVTKRKKRARRTGE